MSTVARTRLRSGSRSTFPLDPEIWLTPKLRPAHPTRAREGSCGDGIDGIADARSASRPQPWAETYAALRDRDPSALTPSELEALADAAWWLSKMDESIASRQRAYAASESARAEHAAAMAARLSIDHFTRGDPAVGAGWLMKAKRHAEDVPEGVGHGFLLIVEATVARYSGDLSTAHELTDRAADVGRRFRDADLIAMAIHTEGILLILAGETDRGVALLDEAMTSVVSGQLSPFFTGIVYCNVIGTCLEIADVRRAGQWSEAARGLVRVPAAGVAVPGDVPRQPCGGREAQGRMVGGRGRSDASVGGADALRSDGGGTGLLRDRGDPSTHRQITGAEESFAQAREIGFDPQPGMALLRFARGDADGALRRSASP